MKSMLVTGGEGMLGRDVMKTFRDAGWQVDAVDLADLDITDRNAFNRLSTYDLVINCAAYTNVDGAESNTEKAFAVNRDGAGNVANFCADKEIRLFHVSTDYVFDGELGKPYTELDRPNPINVYGESKLAGEQAVLAGNARALIVRTQSLFGVNGRNFVRTILAKAKEGDDLRVVSDQVSSPTWTKHLAEAFLCLSKCDENGIVNVSGTGSCTWHEFACAAVERAGLSKQVRPVDSSAYAVAARRPPYSVLDCGKYNELTGEQVPTWQDGLCGYLAEIDGET